MKAKKKKTATAAPIAKDRIGHTIGVKSGKGVSDTWSALLRANAKDKLTDDQLVSRMKKEFPKRKEFQPVGRIRNFYNRGVQGYGNPPGTNINKTAKKSVPYDAKGKETSNSDWGRDRKKDPKLAKLARRRALQQWASGHGKTGKKKGKKAAAKKKKKPASIKTGGKIKLKVKKAA